MGVKPPRIVVVDDEPAILHALRRELRREPWEVQYYSDPLNALEAIREEAPEAVISDNLMPVMTGVELLQIVQREFPDVKKIMLTGSSGKEPNDLIGSEVNLEEVIKKPWDHARLIQAIRKALEGRA